MSKRAKIVELFCQQKSMTEIAKEVDTRYQYVYQTLVAKGLYQPGAAKLPRSESKGIFRMSSEKMKAKLDELDADLRSLYWKGNWTMYRILKKKRGTLLKKLESLETE